ncbi:MAG: hypothetical protein JSV46_04280 [Candidatus Aminicenantes bacterium]|nr:MAG: hypothetical protein JSV46_04280 [Candidatus Aminicenantes bacterium]
MKLKKIIIAISLPLFLSSILLSQSIVEVARKERERRARLKGLKAVVVTNADLGKVRKRVALDTSRIVIPASATAPPGRSIDVDTAEPAPSQPGQRSPSIDTQEPGQSSVEQAEADYYKAREYTQLLTVKLRGLWQDYYNMDDMTDRNLIQKQIAETSLQIEKAQKDEAIAKQMMEDAQRRVRRKIP